MGASHLRIILMYILPTACPSYSAVHLACQCHTFAATLSFLGLGFSLLTRNGVACLRGAPVPEEQRLPEHFPACHYDPIVFR